MRQPESPANPPRLRGPASSGAGLHRLIEHIFADTSGDPMAGELLEWLGASTRFRAFVEGHRDKIRRKVRGAADADARLDVRAELRVARLLLADRRIELEFEAYGSGRAGPDFSVTFRGERSINLEVTRLHGAPTATVNGGPLLAKLRQLPPSVPNALLVAIDGDTAGAFDVAGAARALRARADRKDEAFFIRRGFEGTRDFYERYLRLGGVITGCETAEADLRAALWTNRSARIALPERVAQACLQCLRAA